MTIAGKFIALACVACLVLAAALSVSAQTFYLNPIPPETQTFGLRYMNASLAGSLDKSASSSTYDYFVETPVTKTVGFRLSLPYTKASWDREPDWLGMPRSGGDYADVGNLYLGLYSTRQMSRRTRTVVTVGVHLPTAAEAKHRSEGALYGSLANVHQIRRIVPNAWVVYGNMAWRVESSMGSIFGLELGPEILIAEAGSEADPEVLFHYGISGGVGTRHLTFLAEVMGLFLASQDTDEFSDRFEHHFAFGVGVRNYMFRPSLWYQIPLRAETRDVVEGVIGLQIEVSMPE